MVIFERLAQLLMPADETLAARVVEAPPSWEITEASIGGLDVAVWGRAPLPSGTARAFAMQAALKRERSLMRARKGVGGGLRAVAVHRWAPPNLGSSKPRSALKNGLLGGAIAELSEGAAFRRVLDAASSAAGFPEQRQGFHPGSGGSVRITSVECPDELLRVGAASTPADPGRAADALAALGNAGMPMLPRLVRRGREADASWSVETLLQGVRPDRVGPRLFSELVTFCSQLLGSSNPPDSFELDVTEICRVLPDKSEPILELTAQARAECAMLPSVVRHGDLWSGNLLVSAGGGLAGVLDWDAWHPAAVPAADLLHAHGFDSARRQKLSLGECWLRRPWRDPSFASATEAYWMALGVRPSKEALDAVGLAWWANQVAKSLQRLPHLASHHAWIASNVERVLENSRS